MQQKERAGMIALVGRPNVGKSTLVNQIMGRKVSIVSPKPQTTRSRICAVVRREGCQMVFLDTPGFHLPKNLLGRHMAQVVQESLSGVDAAVLVVEPIPNIGEPERQLAVRARQEGVPLIVAINKVDAVAKEPLLEVLAAYQEIEGVTALIPISAKTGDGVPQLLAELDPHMPEGPPLFPDGMDTDQPDEVLAAEMMREKLLFLLEREVPHGIAVLTERMAKREDGVLEIDLAIICERSSHKGIIIGKEGGMLRQAGALARADMERFFGCKVYLKSWVRVRENWRSRPNDLQRMGFE